jgi:hypothetical protein
MEQTLNLKLDGKSIIAVYIEKDQIKKLKLKRLLDLPFNLGILFEDKNGKHFVLN